MEAAGTQLHSSEIDYIVENIFSTMMGVEVRPREFPFQTGETHLTGAVYLSGDWNGAVLLQCSRRQACMFASRLLSIEPPESITEDVRDVVGELTNMFAGNLTSSVLPNSRISLPSVIEGNANALSIRGKNLLKDQHSFTFMGGTFAVTLIEMWE